MGKHPRFEVETWDQVYEHSFDVARRICQSGFKPDVIVGVCRGGWIPARILSDLLNNPNLASLKVELCCGVEKTKNSPKITQCLSIGVGGKTVLVVDEIVDSGKSMGIATEHVLNYGSREVKTASLLVKYTSKYEPDFFANKVDSWVVFPWEFNETARLLKEKYKLRPSLAKRELKRLIESGVPRVIVDSIQTELSEEKTC